MNKIERIKELVETLNRASEAYYVNDNPIMSDKQYDELYDELERKSIIEQRKLERAAQKSQAFAPSEAVAFENDQKESDTDE